MAFCYNCSAFLRAGDAACVKCGATFPIDAWAENAPRTAIVPEVLAPGELLSDRYRVERFVARGGLGAVYAALDKKTGERVAIKTLRQEFCGEASLVSRFLQEADRLAELRHPRVVRVDERGEHDGVPYFVMEFLSGETVAAAIERDGPMRWRDASLVARHTCEALCAVHALGYVHRDVKPPNLMRTPAGCVLLDFGIMRVDNERLTRTGSFLGTPTYQAPEQALDPRRASVQSDLYSLGVTLFEMLTGHPPFTGATQLELVEQHMTATPPDVCAEHEVPKGLGDLVARCLAKAPRDRVPSAGAMLAALVDVEARHGA